MASFLVVYSTGEGQTAKVADRLAERFSERGHDAEVIDVADGVPAESVAGADAVVVGSSIHGGSHHERIASFVEESRTAFASRPTAFVQVSLSTATDDPERRALAAGYVDDFLETTGWEPDRIGLFGGALRYSKYGFLMRLVMKRIAREATGDVDTSRDYEYTDWEEVRAFADDFAAFVEGRLGGSQGADGGREGT